MIHFIHTWVDGFGIRYLFDRAGDALPRHLHDSHTMHTVEVLSGSVKIIVGADSVVVPRGTTCAFDSTLSHEIVALEPHTEILNRFLHGEPESYVTDLPDSERGGSFERRSP